MGRVFAQIIKLANLPVQYFFFKKKVYFEDGNKKLKKIKGPALIISNHTSVYDYPLIMFTFFNRHIRTLVGETIYNNKSLGRFLNSMGAIKVDRKNYDFSFISKMSKCLEKGQVGLIFPESRLHTDKDPKGLLEFKPSYVYIALKNNVPIIPVFTNGIYGKDKKKFKDTSKIIVGNWIYPRNIYDENKSEKENITYINDYVKNKIINLGQQLDKLK